MLPSKRRRRALTERLNVKLEMKGVEPMKDLVKDFSDGVKLIQVSRPRTRKAMLTVASCKLHRKTGTCLIIQEIMSETSLGRYNKRPIMRVQKAEVSARSTMSAANGRTPPKRSTSSVTEESSLPISVSSHRHIHALTNA